MRDFLNTSNGTSRPGNIANGGVDLEPPPTPLGGRTVSALTVICINYHVSDNVYCNFLKPVLAGALWSTWHLIAYPASICP